MCHDETVVECDVKQAADAKAWLEKAMIEGMDAVMNGTNRGRREVPCWEESEAEAQA